MNKYVLQDKAFNIYAGFYFLSLNKFDKKKPEAKRRYQERKIKKLLQKAYRLPIYRDKFDKAGVKPEDFTTYADLAKFPTLTKDEYRSWMNEELKKPETEYYKKTFTSGSTGIPTTNIYPPKEYAHHYMADFFGWWKGGYNAFKGMSLTRQPGDAGVGNKSLIQKMGILRRECFSTRWDRQRVVEKINDVKPDFILANSSELLYIAQYILDNGITLYKPHYFCPTGENIDGRTEKILKSVYGDGLINIYGGTEMADFAVKKPGETSYEIIEDLVAVMVKEGNGTISKGGKGSLLVTPLFRERYPLINYEIGDYVDLGEKDGGSYIFEISGRKNDVFTWSDGRQTIYKRLEDISMKLQYIFQIRFIQESFEDVTIQVVKDPKCEISEHELEKYVREEYKGQFYSDDKVKIQFMEVIPPDENGKIRVMVSKIKDNEVL